MIALGIDPGTATTGYGVVGQQPGGELEKLAYGVIETPAKMPMEKRLHLLFDQIEQLILLHRPEVCSVEKLFFQRNVTTAIAVGQARGVILLAVGRAGIPLYEYTPLEVKQAVTGYGAADKKQVQEMTRIILNLDEIPKPDDAADALAIAICCLNSSQWRQREIQQP